MKGQKNNHIRRFILIAISFGFIFLLHRLPILEGITSSQKQVIGTFAGALILWLTVAIDWPSVLCIGALALIPELNMKGLLGASFGNATFAFLMFTFLCTYALSETPFIRRCALGFITSRFAKKGAWSLVILFFASVLFIGSFISPTVLFIIYLPIIEEMYSVLKLKKGSSTASMLMVGLVICTDDADSPCISTYGHGLLRSSNGPDYFIHILYGICNSRRSIDLPGYDARL